MSTRRTDDDLCECDRIDKANDPHRHPRDPGCERWAMMNRLPDVAVDPLAVLIEQWWTEQAENQVADSPTGFAVSLAAYLRDRVAYRPDLPESAKAVVDGLSLTPWARGPAAPVGTAEAGWLDIPDRLNFGPPPYADALIERYGNTAMGRAELEAHPVDRPTTVYVDGAYSAKDGVGGWAWCAASIRPGEWVGASGFELDPTSNNRMELRAAISALECASAYTPLTIVSDSAYVVNCFTERWYDGWRANGWRNSKKEPVANRDLWEELLAQLEAHRAPVEWVHVRGHGRGANDDPMHVLGNAEADRLAVAARIEGRGR